MMKSIVLKFKGGSRKVTMHGKDMYGNDVVEEMDVPIDLWEGTFISPLFRMFDEGGK